MTTLRVPRSRLDAMHERACELAAAITRMMVRAEPTGDVDATVTADEFGRALEAEADLVELFEQTLSEAERAPARPTLRLVRGGR